MKEQRSIVNILKSLDTIIAGASLVLLIAVTFFGVIMRYVVSRPFAWEEEVQLGLIVWVVFFGGRYAFVTGNHPAIDMFVDMFPKKAQNAMSVLITVFSICVLFYVGLQGFKYMAQMFRNHRSTNMLHIPFTLIYIALPLGCFLMSLQMTLNTVRRLIGREGN